MIGLMLQGTGCGLEGRESWKGGTHRRIMGNINNNKKGITLIRREETKCNVTTTEYQKREQLKDVNLISTKGLCCSVTRTGGENIYIYIKCEKN